MGFKSKKLPKTFYLYFWDSDPSQIDLHKNQRYVMERLMEWGDLSAMRWLIKYYTRKNLIPILKTTRRLSKKSASFWAILLKVPLEEIRCLNEEFQKTQNPYPFLKKIVYYGEARLASVEDIACMKLDAISSRGTKRDFIDLYFICCRDYKLKQLFLDFDKKYKGVQYNRGHLLKSLTYFSDAEEDQLSHMHQKVAWQKVKPFFFKEASQLISSL